VFPTIGIPFSGNQSFGASKVEASGDADEG